MTTPQTLRDLPYTVAELAELRAIWEPVRPDTDGLAGGYARLMVLRFLATLDRLEAAERALRLVEYIAAQNPTSSKNADGHPGWGYPVVLDLIERARAVISQPHSAEGGRDE